MPRRRAHHRLGIEGDIFGAQAVVLGVLQVVEDLGGAQQRLGRDAAPIEADAAQMLALDDGRFHAELRGANRRDIASGACAHHHKVECAVRHDFLPVA